MTPVSISPVRNSRTILLTSEFARAVAVCLLGLVAHIVIQLLLVRYFHFRGFNPNALYRDLISSSKLPIQYGLLSNIGAMTFVASGATALVGWLSQRPDARNDTLFLLAGAGLSLWLGFDDLLLIHDGYLPMIGVPEVISQGGYAAYAMGWVLLFKRRIFGVSPLASACLVTALCGLAGSVFLDVIPRPQFGVFGLMEEGSKQVGITFWFAYFLQASVHTIRQADGHAAPA